MIRKHLPHDIPSWIDPHRELYFITICCRPRRKNQLAIPRVADCLFETIRHRQLQQIWWPHIFLLMPDHLHTLISFPPSEKRMRTIIGKWKEWTAKTMQITWQDDFFEHRLRGEESRREKAAYILENPVRRGLVAQPGNWRFVYFASGQTPTFSY